MKKLAIIGAVLFALGVLIAIGGIIAAKGDFSVLDVEAGFFVIDTGVGRNEELTERTFSADGIRGIEISALSDDVKIGVSNDGLVHFSYWAGRYKDYSIDMGTDTLTLRENVTKDFRIGFSLNHGTSTLLIPEKILQELKVSTVSGNVDIVAFCKALSIGTTSGKISLEGASEILTVKTVSGNVTLRGFDAKSAKIGTVSGNISGTLAGSVNDYSVRLQTVSGTKNLKEKEAGERRLELSTVSGNMEIGFTE